MNSGLATHKQVLPPLSPSSSFPPSLPSFPPSCFPSANRDWAPDLCTVKHNLAPALRLISNFTPIWKPEGPSQCRRWVPLTRGGEKIAEVFATALSLGIWDPGCPSSPTKGKSCAEKQSHEQMSPEGSRTWGVQSGKSLIQKPWS